MTKNLPVVDRSRGDHIDNVLPYPDQALFLALRGADQEAVMQVLWIYEHPIDLDGVRRFHDNFGHGMLARRIERSPLPFCRHRWVSADSGANREANFTVGDQPRDRSELYDWADEQVDLPLDPERGPGWRLGVQPLADGATVVSLVVSHCIADGAAVVIAVIEAVVGTRRDLGYPLPGSRSRSRAVRSDLRQLSRDLPEVARTLRKAARVAVTRRRDLTRPSPAQSSSTAGHAAALVPSGSAFIDIAEWDALAERLGGNSFSLVAGFAGRIAANLNRTRASDGAVTLMIPVSEREGLHDTGGNVVSIASISFAPADVTTDLTGTRSAIRDGLKTAREVPDEMVELLPLIPFLPKKAIGRMADAAFGFSSDLPVSVSNMGDLPPDALRVDGTEAEYLCFRGADRRASRVVLERRGGILTVTSGRLGSKLCITVISYQPGMENSQSGLRQVMARTLGEFGLSGEIV